MTNIDTNVINRLGNKISVQPGLIVQKYNDVIFLRWDVHDFLERIISELSNCKVLEVGPHTLAEYNCLPLHPTVTPPFIDSRTRLTEKGCEYYSCDMDKNVKADYTMDVNRLYKEVGSGAFDAIIALETMEHTPEFWKIPDTFAKLLKPKGQIYISTPFYVHHHDPHPDYWRFTEEGLEYLFSPKFDIEITKQLWKVDDGQRPVHYTLKGTKK